jgi:hypothetical protein
MALLWDECGNRQEPCWNEGLEFWAIREVERTSRAIHSAKTIFLQLMGDGSAHHVPFRERASQVMILLAQKSPKSIRALPTDL